MSEYKWDAWVDEHRNGIVRIRVVEHSPSFKSMWRLGDLPRTASLNVNGYKETCWRAPLVGEILLYDVFSDSDEVNTVGPVLLTATPVGLDNLTSCTVTPRGVYAFPAGFAANAYLYGRSHAYPKEPQPESFKIETRIVLRPLV